MLVRILQERPVSDRRTAVLRFLEQGAVRSRLSTQFVDALPAYAPHIQTNHRTQLGCDLACLHRTITNGRASSVIHATSPPRAAGELRAYRRTSHRKQDSDPYPSLIRPRG